MVYLDAMIHYLFVGVVKSLILRGSCEYRYHTLAFNRPGYSALKNQMLRPGDVLVIVSLDRLGRDYAQIKDEFRELHSMGVNIVILDMPILSTVDKSDLEKSLIANIVFELLAYTAEKERLNIRSRQESGIQSAKTRGIKFGRPAASAPPDFEAECANWRRGEQTAVETMKRLGLKRSTFYKLVSKQSYK